MLLVVVAFIVAFILLLYIISPLISPKPLKLNGAHVVVSPPEKHFACQICTSSATGMPVMSF